MPKPGMNPAIYLVHMIRFACFSFISERQRSSGSARSGHQLVQKGTFERAAEAKSGEAARLLRQILQTEKDAPAQMVKLVCSQGMDGVWV